MGGIEVLLAFVAVATSTWAFRRMCARLGAALERASAAERELGLLSRSQIHAQQELEFLSRFVREFPHMTRDLHTSLGQRDIARLVLNLATRAFQPRRALVLRRHLRLAETGDSVSRFVVAAATPDAPLQPGAEVPDIGADLEGAVAGQAVVSRRDVGGSAQPGLEFDLAAPIVFGEETLGLIVLCQPVRATEEARAALRLIAQAGAQALHNAAAYRQAQTTANLDGLTGVFNKRHLTQILGEMVVEAGRHRDPVSVFLFDVDHFKHYNDANGHVEGDQLLKELGRLVQDHVRQEDVFGRFGGEEFLLILPRTPLAVGLAVAEKVRGLIATHPFAFSAGQPLGRVSVSGGVAECPGDALDSTRLLKAADEALYAAKRAGRNQVLPAERREMGGPPLEPKGEEAGASASAGVSSK
jgi:diguanylate cyclase (GGDEF)-like protein